MCRDVAHEHELVNSWHISRLIFELEPRDEDAATIFRLVNEEVRAYLESTGQPLFDACRGSELALDGNREVQEQPLGGSRFLAWAGEGAASLARRAG